MAIKIHNLASSKVIDDGVTMSFWRSDTEMIDPTYRPGYHRTQVERHWRGKLAGAMERERSVRARPRERLI